MKNSNIPSGRGIILSGDRQKAGTFLGIAKRKMHDMKQMMSIGKLQMMQRRFMLDRDCIWVHLLSIDGNDFIRIHSCAEGGDCKNGFTETNGSFANEIDFLFHHWNEDGDKQTFFDLVRGHFLFGDNTTGSLSAAEHSIDHIYSTSGDYEISLKSYIRDTDKSIISGTDPLVINTHNRSISVDTSGREGNKYFGTLSFLIDGVMFVPHVMVTINGETISPLIATSISGQGVRLHTPIITGDVMEATVTLATGGFSPTVHWVDGIDWGFIPYKCLSSTRRTITVPIVEE